MICFCRTDLIMGTDTIFPKNLVRKKSRELILKNYPNKRRQFYFFSNSSVFKNIGIKSENFIISDKKNHFEFFKNFVYFLSYIYTFGQLSNYFNVFLINGIFGIEKIFNILNAIVFLFIVSTFFSCKKLEHDLLIKTFTTYIYFNLVRITEKFIILSGAEGTWVFFKVINNLILSSYIWLGKNNISEYSILNKNYNVIFWQIRTLFTSLLFLDTIFKFLLNKISGFYFDQIFNFPDFYLSYYIFLGNSNYLKMIMDLWVFSTLSISLMIITFLILIYFIAFVKNNKNFQETFQLINKFRSKKFQSEKIKNKKMNIPVSSISNLNSSKLLDERTIEDLLKSEKKKFLVKFKGK